MSPNPPTPAASSARAADGGKQLLVSFAAGKLIFEEGQRGAEMYIIESGQVEIVRRRGGEERNLVLLEAGDFFGEMSVLEDLPRSATARAKTDCRLLPVDASTFDLMLRDHPEVAIRIMRMLSRRLRHFDEAEQRAQAIAAGPLAQVRGTSISPVAVKVEEPPGAPAPAARLLHTASGSEFVLTAEGEHVVGRKDPVTGLSPDINLTALDTQRSLSRRHARISVRGGQVFLREEIGTANGTFVNGARLTTGKEVEVTDGQTIGFGLVQLLFRTGAPGAGA